MYGILMSVFDLTIQDEATRQQASSGGQQLLSLCQKEAEAFSDYLDRYAQESKDQDAPMWTGGLADWERKAVAEIGRASCRERV